MDNRNGSTSSTARAPRAVGWLALAGVSLIAGIASYFHAYAVVVAAGARPPVAYLVPALADLVILGASADLLAASRARQPRPPLTMLALGTGIAVTLAMNISAGGGHGLGGRLVAGWPALAFTLALESLAGLARRGRGTPQAFQSQPEAAMTAEAAWKALTQATSQRRLAELLDVPRSRIAAMEAKLAAPAEAGGAEGRPS